MSEIPDEQTVRGYFDALSNWGRWGDDDELGTMNLVTPEKRRRAAHLVSEGTAVSCAWTIDTAAAPGQMAGPPQRFMVGTGESAAASEGMGFAMEHIGLVYHGLSVTHIDGLSHVFWQGKMYNGRSAALVMPARGATALAITGLREGVVTRGVLLDVAASEGVPWLPGGYGVGPEALEAAERRQGVTVEPGDVVLLRTGFGRRRVEEGNAAFTAEGYAGWHASALPWLRERGVAAIGCDTAQDASPSDYPSLMVPIHTIGIVAMGLWLIDNCNLEDVAATCERLQRWECQFVLSPLAFVGATGSPANPLAIF